MHTFDTMYATFFFFAVIPFRIPVDQTCSGEPMSHFIGIRRLEPFPPGGWPCPPSHAPSSAMASGCADNACIGFVAIDVN